MHRTREDAKTLNTIHERSRTGQHDSTSMAGHATVALSLVVVAWIGLRSIPPSVCFSDGGGLQLASATLGITHPPGYPLLASIGYLISRIPFVDPAYTINVACCLAGVGVLWLLIRLQVHLGASTLPACVASLVVAHHPRFWINLTTPESYMPTLAMLATGVWCLSRYASSGKRRSLWSGALLLGMAAVTRPPLVFVMPFVAVVIWMARDAHCPILRHALKSILVPALGLAIPATYAAGYLWSRDNDKNPFNYLRQHDTEYGSLPDVDSGWRARAERIWWLASARQYQNLIDVSVSRMQKRLRWLGRRIVPDHMHRIWPILLLAVAGGITAFRRRPRTTVLLFGVISSAAGFVLVYRVPDDAADVLPVLFVGAVCCGVAVSLIFHDGIGAIRTCMIRMAFISMLVLMPGKGSALPSESLSVDATIFLDAANLQSLPPGSIILGGWRTSTPLLYAQAVWGQATHVTVIHASHVRWGRFVTAYEGHPIYMTTRHDRWPGYTPERHGSLWHLTKE